MSVQRRQLLLPAKYADLQPVFDALLRDVLRDVDVRNSLPDDGPGLVYVDGNTFRRLKLGAGLVIVGDEIRAP